MALSYAPGALPDDSPTRLSACSTLSHDAERYNADVFPCDAAAGKPTPLLRWGGRLSRVGEGWWLTDAYARCPLELPAGSDFAARDGVLCVVLARWDGQRLLVESGLWAEAPVGAPSRHDRWLAEGLGERLRARAALLQRIRDFFCERGFLEVETPSQTDEHALEAFVEPVACGRGHLITSPELHMKRLLVAGAGRIFQLSRCFRADEHGPWHRSEFLMLEWYRAFSSCTQIMKETEQLVRFLADSDWLSLASGQRIRLDTPFERLTVREAYRRYAGVSDAAALAFSDEAAFFQLLVDRVEPGLRCHERPVFLCDYPASQAALARRKPTDPSVAERFELYLGGVELCNGYGELTCPREQRRRFELEAERRNRDRAGPVAGLLSPQLPERFLEALGRGMPPSGGNALGVERLLALILGQPGLAGVRAFPDEGAF